jgi:hypothetical protein
VDSVTLQPVSHSLYGLRERINCIKRARLNNGPAPNFFMLRVGIKPARSCTDALTSCHRVVAS